MKALKNILIFFVTICVLLITLYFNRYLFKNNNNLISMFEKRGDQLKLIPKIPESPNLKLIYECKENAFLEWDNTKRQIRFSSDTETAKCNLTFQQPDVTLGLTPTSGNTTVNKTLTSEITGSGYGALTCNTSDSLVATCSISDNILSVKAGTKTGVATITLKEDIENKTATYTINVDVLKLAWVRTFGGTEYDYFYDITQTADGGYIAVGKTYSDNIDVVGITKNSSWDTTAIIVKYDANGNVLWKKFFGGNSEDYFKGVTEISGGYIAVGASASSTGDLAGVNPDGKYQGTVVKYDTNGNVVWKKFLLGHDYRKIVKTTDGVVIAGTKLGYFNWTIGVGPSAPTAAYIVKYDLNGNVVWQTYCHDKSTNDTQFNDIAVTNGGFVAVGNRAINSSGTGYLLIAKYNASGTKLWEQEYGESKVLAVLFGVIGGDEIVTVGAAKSEAIITKLNNNTGDLVWTYTYPGNLADEFNDTAAVSDGYIVTGGSSSTNITANKGGQDALIIKVNTSGDLIWARHFGGNSYETFSSIKTTSNKIVAVGYSDSNNGDTSGINKGLLDGIIYNFDY